MSDKSRRKLLKSIAAGSGAIVAGKTLPENWVKPVVDSVMLPAHAQTSGPQTITFTQTLRVDIPDAAGDNYNPAPYPFNVSGFTPAGPGTLSVEALGDYAALATEFFTYAINDLSNTVLGQVPNPGGSGTECGTTPETGSFPVSLTSLQEASAGGTVVITPLNGGQVDAICESTGQYISLTLTFPATN